MFNFNTKSVFRNNVVILVIFSSFEKGNNPIATNVKKFDKVQLKLKYKNGTILKHSECGMINFSVHQIQNENNSKNSRKT